MRMDPNEMESLFSVSRVSQQTTKLLMRSTAPRSPPVSSKHTSVSLKPDPLTPHNAATAKSLMKFSINYKIRLKVSANANIHRSSATLVCCCFPFVYCSNLSFFCHLQKRENLSSESRQREKEIGELVKRFCCLPPLFLQFDSVRLILRFLNKFRNVFLDQSHHHGKQHVLG